MTLDELEAGRKLKTAWRSMRRRCRENHASRSRYYDRGISVCREWEDSFSAFAEHIGLPPTQAHEVDRIDNDKGYFPGNVRWATHLENCRNKERQLVTIKGVTKSVAEWMEHFGRRSATFYLRMSRGWCVEDALSKSTKRDAPSNEALENGISRACYYGRIKKYGWSHERAISTPSRSRA